MSIDMRKALHIVYLFSLIICASLLVFYYTNQSHIFDFETRIYMLALCSITLQLVFFVVRREAYGMSFVSGTVITTAAILTYIVHREVFFNYLLHYDLSRVYGMIASMLCVPLVLLLIIGFKYGKDTFTDLKKIWKPLVIGFACCLIVFVGTSDLFAKDFDISQTKKYYENERLMAAGDQGVIYLQDGKVKSMGALPVKVKADVESWKNVISVAALGETYYGITDEGTVLLSGEDESKFSAVKEWKEIRDIALHFDFVLGLKEDGSIMWEGDVSRVDIESLDGVKIKQIEPMMADCVAVLTEDGSLYVLGEERRHFTDAEKWRNIAFISADEMHLLGLTKTGEVLAAGSTFFGVSDVAGMRHIAYVYAGCERSVLITTDGALINVGIEKKSPITSSGDVIALADNITTLYVYDDSGVHAYE